MSELAKLLTRRNVLIAQVRGELSVADAIQQRKPSVSEVKDRLNQLKELAASFRETQSGIEEKQDDPEAIATVHNVREEFFGMFYRAKDIFEGYLDVDDAGSSASQQTLAGTNDWKEALHLLIETQRKLMLDQAMTTKTVQSLSEITSATHPGGGQVSNGSPLNVRLPPINIQSFAGDRKQWMTFKDIYVSTIHNRVDITDALKMQYLFSYLEGDAKRLVSKFTISGANYQNAWSTLINHFDKKRYTVFTLVHEFIAQSPVTQATSQSLSRLVTTSDEIIQQLDALGDEFTGRDPWLIHLILEKLDKDTRASWSQEVVDTEDPTFEDLLQFLKKRCEVLETCSAFSKKPVSEPKKDLAKPVPTKVKMLHTTVDKKCAKCNSEHNIYQCEEFKNMSVKDRRELVQKARLCFNCLRPFHSVKSCISKSVCRNLECKQRHHTLLCPVVKKPEQIEVETKAVNTASVEVPAKEEEAVVALTAEVPQGKKKSIPLLPTAVVKVQYADGGFISARVLIDSGSQASLVTEACVRKLKLPRRNGKIVVNGLGQQEMGTTRGLVTLRLASRFNDVVVLTTEAYILGKLTTTIPSQRFNPDNMKLLEGLGELADPEFNQPGAIDIILGADVFLALLEGGQVKNESGHTVAQQTIFGWIVAGRYDASEEIQNNHAVINLHVDMDLNRTLQQFWEQEEIFNAPPLTPSEQQVTEHFSSTVQRDETGRFIVKLPFDDSKPALGDSLAIATKRFRSIERRFQLDPDFKYQYVSFMRVNLELGHMEEIPADQIQKNSSECYYLTHHAVIKSDSMTTKLRVVFDASCASSSGVSLNDRLLAGPNNNADLFNVSLRFRSHRVAFSADVAKMYRQARMHPVHCDYQRIVFREEPDQPLKHYRLCTVTYGTKTAPYLAIECMREAAKPFEAVYPKAVEAIRLDFYVDDFLSGADNEDEANQLKQQVVEILSSAGFELRKWSSNNRNLLPSTDNDEAASVPVKMLNDSETVKALGINWYPVEDMYGFNVNFSPLSVNTKRQMISDSARLFDPFGWLAPVTVKIKILYQHLWLFDVAWDDPLPPAVEDEWEAVKQNLSKLEAIRIPRCIFPSRGRIQLHGFSDASEQAYAAVVYARTVDEEGHVSVVLVAAKSRVAPIKQISLPRLELNGAHLLTELMRQITEALPHVQVEHWAWTDSSIVLQWLASHPRRWKTFVANRTSAILDYLPRSCWHHVTSKHNPADLASRGLSPAELVDNQLWFQGAPWLKEDESSWNQGLPLQAVDEDAMEVKRIKSLHTATMTITTNYEIEKQLIIKCSSFPFMVRSLAWVHRAIHNFKSSVRNQDTDGRRTGEHTPDELHRAKIQLLQAAQHDEYGQEMGLLRNGRSLQGKNILSALHPFLDADGTMRVGGRLQNSDQPYDVKHPIILPQKHRATELLVRDLHLRDLHAGSTLLAATLRQNYWIIGSQTVVRKVVQGCTRCVRLKGKTAGQLMGSLPPARVLATRAFSHVGVDYAGPVKLKATCVRGVKITKGYLVVFVCLSTRAVHLEVASDLSSDTFLGALKRFISRRGYPVEIRSDNGTNFVGADRKLQEFLDQILSHSKHASRYFSNLGIHWVFNPPSAPHMGGIWEAAVRSVKKHLVAELGESAITFEQLSTILCQIESCLNSRPLCPLSSDPDSVEALTPGHFLIGQPMNLVPEPSTKHLPANRLDKWQEVQQRTERVWDRWKDEYLASLQPRSKWRTAQPNVDVGQLVLVKNDNAPPAQWELARVEKVHPDASGAVRVVTLRRGSTVYQRPIHKLCVLPSD